MLEKINLDEIKARTKETKQRYLNLGMKPDQMVEDIAALIEAVEERGRAIDEIYNAGVVWGESEFGIWEHQAVAFQGIEGDLSEYVATGHRSNTYVSHAPHLAKLLTERALSAKDKGEEK